MSRAAGSKVRGFIYWILTAGPVGVFAGTLLKGRVFDRFGPIAVPRKTKPDTIGAIVFGVYEYPERVLIERWLPSDLDCIELGCSIGVVSRVILNKLRANKSLIGVEASKDLLELSRENVAAAGFADRFRPVHGAVHYDGQFVAFVQDKNHIRGKINRSESQSGALTPCITLAQLLQHEAKRSFSLVMDIEGSEFDLLTHDSASLANCRAIIVEVHGNKSCIEKFTAVLKQQNFALTEAKHSVFAFIKNTD